MECCLAGVASPWFRKNPMMEFVHRSLTLARVSRRDGHAHHTVPTVACFLSLAFLAIPLAAQNSLESICDASEVQAVDAREPCLAVVQAATSGQPVLGLLMAAGNPTMGTLGATGFRLGILPRVSAGARLNLVAIRLPDILADEIPGQVGAVTRRFGAPAPALLGDVAISVTNGFSIEPGVGGIGAVSLIGTVSYLPFRLFDIDGFGDSPDLALGIGGRLQLLEESFVTPGVSFSVMRRRLNTVRFGDVCPAGSGEVELPGATPPHRSTCAGPGDPGEFGFDLTSWSSRLVAAKHLLGFGLAGGIGHDSNRSRLDFGFRGGPVSGTSPAFRVTDQTLRSDRWTVFGNASYTLIVFTLGLEAGWQQGAAPITGFGNLGSDFDPRSGTWFGNLGVRLAL